MVITAYSRLSGECKIDEWNSSFMEADKEKVTIMSDLELWSELEQKKGLDRKLRKCFALVTRTVSRYLKKLFKALRSNPMDWILESMDVSSPEFGKKVRQLIQQYFLISGVIICCT